MKEIFALAILLISTVSWSAEKNVLLVFPEDGMFRSMSASIKKGIFLYRKAHPEIDRSLHFVEINSPSELKSLADLALAGIKKYEPIAIVGGVTSSEAMAIGDVAEANGVLYIAPYATSPIVTANKKHVFTTCFDNNHQSKSLANFIFKKQKQSRGVIFFDEKDPYSKNIRDSFVETFTKLGGQIVGEYNVPSQAEITPKMQDDIRAAKADFAVIAAYQTTAAGMISLLRASLGNAITFYGPDSWAGGPTFRAVLSNNDKDISAYYVDHWAKAPQQNKESKLYFSAIKQNLATLKETAAYYDNTGSALGYDAALVLSSAMAGPTPALEKNMKSVHVSGVTGDFSYANGNSPDKSIFVFSVNNKAERLVDKY